MNIILIIGVNPNRATLVSIVVSTVCQEAVAKIKTEIEQEIKIGYIRDVLLVQAPGDLLIHLNMSLVFINHRNLKSFVTMMIVSINTDERTDPTGTDRVDEPIVRSFLRAPDV